MVVNDVFLKLNGPENIKYVMEQLQSMKGKISPLDDIAVGKCVRSKDFDIVMATYFHTLDAFDAYLIDPLHVEVSKNIGSMIAHQVSACYEL